MDNEIEELYPRYGLYAYGEGFVTEKLRRMYFSGIPVLFVPGNAGSHEQGFYNPFVMSFCLGCKSFLMFPLVFSKISGFCELEEGFKR